MTWTTRTKLREIFKCHHQAPLWNYSFVIYYVPSETYIIIPYVSCCWSTFSSALLEWPKSRMWTFPNLGRMWNNSNFHFFLVEIQNVFQTGGNTVWKTVWKFIRKYTPTIWSSNNVPWSLPKELETYVCADTCTQMFMAALLLICKTWRQLRYLSVGKWINSLWNLQRA